LLPGKIVLCSSGLRAGLCGSGVVLCRRAFVWLCGCSLVWLCGSVLRKLLPEDLLQEASLLQWFVWSPARQVVRLRLQVVLQQLQQLQFVCGPQLCGGSPVVRLCRCCSFVWLCRCSFVRGCSLVRLCRCSFVLCPVVR